MQEGNTASLPGPVLHRLSAAPSIFFRGAAPRRKSGFGVDMLGNLFLTRTQRQENILVGGLVPPNARSGRGFAPFVLVCVSPFRASFVDAASLVAVQLFRLIAWLIDRAACAARCAQYTQHNDE